MREKHKDEHTKTSGLPRVYTFKEAVKEFGSAGITIKSLRREAKAGRLRGFRSRPGFTSKLLFTEEELLRWLKEEAGKRQYVVRGGAK